MNNNINQFVGTAAAFVTPFNEDKSVDLDGLKSLIQHTGDHLDYWVVNGTTAESVTLTNEEKEQIKETFVANNPHNKPIMWGLGGYNTKHIVESVKTVDTSVISAILSVTPPYNRPAQQGLIEHYIQIADASPVPVMLYNVPSRTGINMLAETVLELSEHENIFGVKEASGNLLQCMEIAKHKSDDFLLVSGDDMLTIPMISIGGEGVISVIAQAFPKQFSESVNLILNGQQDEAQNAYYPLLEINNLLFAEGNPAGVKSLLQSLDIIQSRETRLPIVAASDELKAQIEDLLEKELGFAKA